MSLYIRKNSTGLIEKNDKIFKKYKQNFGNAVDRKNNFKKYK